MKIIIDLEEEFSTNAIIDYTKQIMIANELIRSIEFKRDSTLNVQRGKK